MPDARILIAAIAVIVIAGCQKAQQQPDNQNIIISNEVPANADIETLPPDESAGTPADQLENGSDNADVAGPTSNGD
jgi:hypothetical protein